MKKILAFTLMVVMCLSLVACINENETSSDSSTQATTETSSSSGTGSSITSTGESSSSSSSSNSEINKERVTCSMCNGTGKVKYYYGDNELEAALNGHDDYEYGTCSSCKGTGYRYVTTSGGTGSSGNSSNMRTCPSCGKKVSSLQTEKDAAGVSRTWCSSCWAKYHAILGR